MGLLFWETGTHKTHGPPAEREMPSNFNMSQSVTLNFMVMLVLEGKGLVRRKILETA